MKVQVCSFRDPNFDQNFINSLENTGFAVITNHGIDFSLIRNTQRRWKEFFLSNTVDKEFYLDKEDPNMGYKSFGVETAVGSKLSDLKEFYHYRPDHSNPYEVHDQTSRLFYDLEDIGLQLISIIDKQVPGAFSYREACQDSNQTILRTIYYPALNFKVEPGQVRAAEHCDINFITLLVAASAPGLEVKDSKGNWHSVPFEENSLICNIGDMLELASGGHFPSTTHRVVNPDDSTSDRLSMPMFLHAKPNTILADGITAEQFLNERLDQIYNRK